DKHSILTPLIRPFLKLNILDISESKILDVLKRPLSRNVYEMAFVWASKAERGIFWKSTNRDGMLNLNAADGRAPRAGHKHSGLSLNAQPRNEEDEQWLSRLRSLGMGPEDEFKLLALREYIWRVSMRQARDEDTVASTLNN